MKRRKIGNQPAATFPSHGGTQKRRFTRAGPDRSYTKLSSYLIPVESSHLTCGREEVRGSDEARRRDRYFEMPHFPPFLT